ncbi:MAG: TldD/PmbA family protein [Elusimicrobia bacterium]|nr:TldD/PmbA family protein [Elusimicrobiota bacterium]
MTADLKALSAELLDWARRQDPGLQAELYLARSEERGVEMREGRLDNMQHGSAEGAGLRLLGDGRMGFASAGGISPEGIQDLYRKAREQLAHIKPDPCKDFPAPSPDAPDAALADSLWDEELFKTPLEAAVQRLADSGAAAVAGEPRLAGILRSGYGESRGEVVIANTRGVLSHERGSSASVGYSALAKDSGEVQVGSAYQSSCRGAALDFGRVAAQAAERTVRLLGGRKLSGAQRAVLFDPWAAGDILELVAGLLCADQVQRGKSLLAGCLGRKVGSDLATFRDDPRRHGGLGSCLHDDEGLPTSAKTMIESGVVKDYFYDTYTSRKDQRAGNASAGRGSYKGLPGPTHSNFYLEPGTMSRDQLVSDTADGLLVLDIMGMHMADPISGEFSVGVSGLAVSGGKLGAPVKKAMIAGSFKDLLAGIDAKADDLTFYGSLGSPTFRVGGMSVA